LLMGSQAYGKENCEKESSEEGEEKGCQKKT
jgi:hypothetical protein